MTDISTELWAAEIFDKKQIVKSTESSTTFRKICGKKI